jgi:hypothetical protein
MAVGMALLLALSVLAPTAAAAETTMSVETVPASDVTDRSATLHGNLTELGDAENATVHFEYWVEGDRENSTNTTEMTVGNGTFGLPVSDLSNDTTYAYVAHANVSDATTVGAERTFTTLAEPPLGVDTLAASDVTPTSATLEGELTGLGGAGNATVHFEYWVEGDRGNSSTTGAVEVGSTGTFEANASGLSYNETYVYVAHAEADDTTVTGDRATFTPALNEEAAEDQPFGHWVSAFVHSLIGSEDLEERNLGQAVSTFVTENNPGADNRPDHAGPDGERGERGPPEDRGNDDEGDDERPSEDRSDEGDDERPSEDRSDEGDEDERGPPTDRGNGKDKDNGERGPPETGDDEEAGEA